MPELRKDPLIGRWVIIATDRAKRPIDFLTPQEDPLPQAECPFCEGHEDRTQGEIMAVRADGGQINGNGWSVRVIPSINPVLRIEGGLNRRAKGMYDLMNGVGAHEIIVETPQHIANAVDLPASLLCRSFEVAQQRMRDLERDARFRFALWFKNYGAIAGAGRVPHSRSQIIATPVTPLRLKEELAGARRHFEEKERCLLCDVINQERDAQARVVMETASMMVLCPFASRFPFEVWIVPTRHSSDFARTSPEALNDLAQVFKQVLGRLKGVLDNPPYNALLHTAPFRNPPDRISHWKTLEEDYHWHIELIPRLTRLGGFEWGSGFYISATPPEEAARYLREAVVPEEAGALR